MHAAAVTILLSSFLLFLVQPILAKQMLPWFGGSAGVWAVCLVFFQVVLVFGYAYAHLLTRVREASRQFTLHIALLLASCLTLPVIPGSFWKPTDAGEPTLRILGLLAATVGMQYFLLASTAPLLQKWLSTGEGTGSQRLSIYRLYALSNFGSLVGVALLPVRH